MGADASRNVDGFTRKGAGWGASRRFRHPSPLRDANRIPLRQAGMGARFPGSGMEDSASLRPSFEMQYPCTPASLHPHLPSM